MKKKAGRPKKKASDVKNVDLRIPVTESQKKQIQSAAGDMGIAEWARGILLAASEKPRD